jgi:hypothetical protein
MYLLFSDQSRQTKSSRAGLNLGRTSLHTSLISCKLSFPFYFVTSQRSFLDLNGILQFLLFVSGFFAYTLLCFSIEQMQSVLLLFFFFSDI